MQQRSNGRDIEARLHIMLIQELQDTRHAHSVTVLAPCEAPDRLAAVAQIAGLVVAVERQRDRTSRAARPFGRTQLAPGAHPVDELAPVLLGPLPRFEVALGSSHLFFLQLGALPAEKARGWSER